jgi:hypothetical protein
VAKKGVLQLFLVLTSLLVLIIGLWTLLVAHDKSQWGSVSGALGQWVGGLAAAVAIVATWFLARRDATASEARWKQDAAESEKRWTEELRRRELSERASRREAVGSLAVARDYGVGLGFLHTVILPRLPDLRAN